MRCFKSLDLSHLNGALSTALIYYTILKKQHPYRYSYGQKIEIERIVKEMLESGNIRPSQSSFASLMLLVKKKDGGWRLCVDYRWNIWDISFLGKALPLILRRKFIKGYGIISKLLTSLLKNDAFEWNPEVEIAFNRLKEVMTIAIVLTMPDFSQPFVVETDACGKGIGVILMQGSKPIAYLSKALATKNFDLSTYEKEFLALLLVVTK
ncbi:UNVERIFIED_CONTAM: hypothetical protein Sradi_0881300 [Sesamum radiatum]|uniref:Reverse transcriptase/retrotransposon-derived protein RNase H-like domain-containing protein n=1 Tax=Sesamum radiatum TaxID=300843 RepID=A0AAW2V489_SESRA